jgi:hypothetical protein
MASGRKRLIADGSKRYDVVYRDLDRRQRWKNAPRKVDAEAFANMVEADKVRGSYIDPDAGKVTVKAYGETWLTALTLDPSTREAVEGRFRRPRQRSTPDGVGPHDRGCPASTSWPASTPSGPAGTDHVDRYQFHR